MYITYILLKNKVLIFVEVIKMKYLSVDRSNQFHMSCYVVKEGQKIPEEQSNS